MIPNVITSFRILFVPLFVYAYFSSSPYNLYYAIGVLLLSAITDILDGYIARRFQMVTKIGQVLDPLVDKAVQLTVFICLMISDMLPIWVFGIIIAKEVIMVAGSTYLLKRKVTVSANWYGKMATVLFYIAVVVMIFTSKVQNIYLNSVLISVIILSTLFAFVMYFWSFKDILLKQTKRKQQ